MGYYVLSNCLLTEEKVNSEIKKCLKKKNGIVKVYNNLEKVSSKKGINDFIYEVQVYFDDVYFVEVKKDNQWGSDVLTSVEAHKKVKKGTKSFKNVSMDSVKLARAFSDIFTIQTIEFGEKDIKQGLGVDLFKVSKKIGAKFKEQIEQFEKRYVNKVSRNSTDVDVFTNYDLNEEDYSLSYCCSQYRNGELLATSRVITFLAHSEEEFGLLEQYVDGMVLVKSGVYGNSFDIKL